ncbi:unnamed protein product [Bemisia tabaci]|uniref:Uncharacterized protein n=1 Tax=Bemisia tabaci TaxID=7038 RepID=A0A9P0AFG3_BEMTA|nr:unnamed protein product [Bemisia tabaci]
MVRSRVTSILAATGAPHPPAQSTENQYALRSTNSNQLSRLSSPPSMQLSQPNPNKTPKISSRTKITVKAMRQSPVGSNSRSSINKAEIQPHISTMMPNHAEKISTTKSTKTAKPKKKNASPTDTRANADSPNYATTGVQTDPELDLQCQRDSLIENNCTLRNNNNCITKINKKLGNEIKVLNEKVDELKKDILNKEVLNQKLEEEIRELNTRIKKLITKNAILADSLTNGNFSPNNVSTINCFELSTQSGVTLPRYDGENIVLKDDLNPNFSSNSCQKSKKKVLILSDSHGRNLAQMLKNRLGSNQHFETHSIFKPNALFKNVIEDIGNLTKGFTKNDFVFVIAGSNDLFYHYESPKYDLFTELCKAARLTSHTNLVIPKLFHRFDVPNYVAITFKRFYDQLILRATKMYNHVSEIDFDYLSRSHFTFRGLHLNTRGKQEIVKLIHDRVLETLVTKSLN